MKASLSEVEAVADSNCPSSMVGKSLTVRFVLNYYCGSVLKIEVGEGLVRSKDEDKSGTSKATRLVKRTLNFYTLPDTFFNCCTTQPERSN